MSKRLTLAEQLAQIAEPAPQDFDPEDSYATYGNERNQEDKQDLEAARAEYVEVGASKLRKKGEAVYDAKYAGKKGSRKELEIDHEEDEDEEMDGDEDDEEGDDDDEESGEDDDEEAGDFEDLEDEEEDEDEEPEEEAPVVKVKKPTSKTSSKSKSTTTEQDEKAMLKQLKQAASADVDKGRDVKKQLAFCDNILEQRIKIQKATTAANSLPLPSTSALYYSELSEELSETLLAVQSMNEELFALRRDLIKNNESLELPPQFGSLRKRKRVTTDSFDGASHSEYLSASLSDLSTLETILTPYLRSTISKWSDKVQAASGLAIGQNKKFKAVNPNVLVSIDHALDSSERERLVRRTRVRRSAGLPVGIKVEEEEIVLEGEKRSGKKEELECFDDADFYQQLLRDVVESRMLDLDDPTLASLRLASARGKKTKKIVDTRASKGRKIRYHVHEKIQSFMVPIDAGGWHEEQVDELFAGLLGRTFDAGNETVQEVRETAGGMGEARKEGNVDVGSLRIFG